MKHAARRLLLAVPTLFVVTFAVFVLVDLSPGDPAASLAGPDPTEQRIEQIRERLNLDDPLLVRYGQWLGDVAHGDFGVSLGTGDANVSDVVFPKIPVTLSIAGLSIVISTSVAFVLALIAAHRPGGLADRLITAGSSIALAAPPFLLGLLLIYVFALRLGWFPAVGYTPLSEGVWPWLQSILLPAIALGMMPASELTLQLKAALSEVLGRDYILTAEAMGLPRRRIVGKHALKNACVPVITVLGFRLAQILGGSAAIEFVFNIRGVGWLAYDAALDKDVPVLLAIVVLSTLVVIVVNALIDISYGYFNPKVRTAQ